LKQEQKIQRKKVYGDKMVQKKKVNLKAEQIIDKINNFFETQGTTSSSKLAMLQVMVKQELEVVEEEIFPIPEDLPEDEDDELGELEDDEETGDEEQEINDGGDF